MLCRSLQPSRCSHSNSAVLCFCNSKNVNTTIMVLLVLLLLVVIIINCIVPYTATLEALVAGWI